MDKIGTLSYMFIVSIAASAWVFMSTIHADKMLINEIRVIIYHEMGTFTVLASDMRPGLDGRMQTLRDVILNRLMQADALYHKVIVTPEQADRYIENIQKQNRLSRKAVEELFAQAGYTYQEAREYLRERQMIEQIVEFRVKSDKRMIVSRADAEKRYQEKIPSTEPVYTLAIAFVAQSALKDKTIDAYLSSINPETDLTYDEPFDLKESEIAHERSSIIASQQQGQIVFSELVDGGYEVTRLVKKTASCPIAFDDCYTDIITTMRKERLKDVFNEYYTMLISQATFHFTYPEEASVLTAQSS